MVEPCWDYVGNWLNQELFHTFFYLPIEFAFQKIFSLFKETLILEIEAEAKLVLQDLVPGIQQPLKLFTIL